MCRRRSRRSFGKPCWRQHPCDAPVRLQQRPDPLDAPLETALAAEKSVPWRLVWTAGVAAAEALLRYADPDDLLVLGNRGGGRLAGHVTESVTRAVLDEMPCDVMLVPL